MKTLLILWTMSVITSPSYAGSTAVKIPARVAALQNFLTNSPAGQALLKRQPSFGVFLSYDPNEALYRLAEGSLFGHLPYQFPAPLIFSPAVNDVDAAMARAIESAQIIAMPAVEKAVEKRSQQILGAVQTALRNNLDAFDGETRLLTEFWEFGPKARNGAILARAALRNREANLILEEMIGKPAPNGFFEELLPYLGLSDEASRAKLKALIVREIRSSRPKSASRKTVRPPAFPGEGGPVPPARIGPLAMAYDLVTVDRLADREKPSGTFLGYFTGNTVWKMVFRVQQNGGASHVVVLDLKNQSYRLGTPRHTILSRAPYAIKINLEDLVDEVPAGIRHSGNPGMVYEYLLGKIYGDETVKLYLEPKGRHSVLKIVRISG